MCRGDTQYARQIIGPGSEEQKKDDVPSPEVVQADPLLHNPITAGYKVLVKEANLKTITDKQSKISRAVGKADSHFF